MKASFLVLAVVVVLGAMPGCGGGPDAYPETDVANVPGFKLTGASDIKKSVGVLIEGTLTYEGSGHVAETYMAFLEEMKELGWISGRDKIETDKAMGSLHKGNRTCSIDLVKEGGRVKATVKVGTSQ